MQVQPLSDTQDSNEEQGRSSETDRSESRRSFLQRSATVTATGAAVALVGTKAVGAGIAPQNVLPRLYPGWNARNFVAIRQHENSHVIFLQNALGADAFDDPGFVDITSPTAQNFAWTAQVFENTGVATYLGAAPLIFNSGYLAAAAAIALIEARHAGYLNTLLNDPVTESFAPGAAVGENFETPQTPTVTAQAIKPFLANPTMGAELAAAISTTPSAANDIAILRFALLLEYLERDFYNINVPRFLTYMSS